MTTVLGDSSTGLISPGAVTLADLNNNGILDLIVANTGSNNVLVYPGLGNGAFGPALNDGHGFFTGTNPAGITVADLTGNGRLDLIIADKGSNDVSILFNEKVGNSFTFVAGPRLSVGVGPVSTVVTNVLGSTVPDLLVVNSGSNNVMLLQGLGNGFFNDQSPIIYNVGTNPTQLFLGNFVPGSGPDLVTINSGSNDVSLISGLGGPSQFTQTISSGGLDPTAAVMLGQGPSGLDNLLVANNGDGNFALFQGSAGGLVLSNVVSSPGFPNPSALALASFSGGNLEFYATNDGEASASLLGFQLDVSGTLSGLSQTGATSSAASLVSLNETSLALVGTLLTVTLDLQTETSEAASGPGGSGQSVVNAAHTADESEEAPAAENPAQPVAAKEEPSRLSWDRFVIGLDEAIKSLRNEANVRLHEEEQRTKPQNPGTTQLNPDDAARQPATTSFSLIEQAIFAAGRAFEAGDDRLGAVDKAIGSWGEDEPASTSSIFPVLPDSTITRAPAASAQFVIVKDAAQLFPGLDAEPERTADHFVRVATLVAISAIATTARETLLKRSTVLVGAGSPAPRRSRWAASSRRRRDRRA